VICRFVERKFVSDPGNIHQLYGFILRICQESDELYAGKVEYFFTVWSSRKFTGQILPWKMQVLMDT
jgi:hypothetical protein